MISNDFEYKLAVFDFDYTIVNANSNNYLNKLVIERQMTDNPSKNTTPSIATLNKFKYPPEIEHLHNKNNLTVRQNAVFKFMHENHNIDKDTMVKCLGDINISDSMRQLFYFLKENNYDLVIISDSNTFLIETILRRNNVAHLFEPCAEKILANRSEFDETGRLHVVPFNRCLNKNGADFVCSSETCRLNMCKGSVLEDFIQRSMDINMNQRVIYVGDGHIDFCPGTKLKEGDTFFVKKNSSLSKLLESENYKAQIKSSIKLWKTANEILSQL